MEFKLFANKKLSGDKDKLFLAQPTMLFGSLNPSDYFMIAKHVVKLDDLVRPDRISVEHYNSTSGLDIILKFNGISDPFSINVGDTLWIPMDNIPYFKLESPSMFEDNPIKNQFIKTKRLSKTDQRRLEALKKKYNKENLLPPNVIPVGRKNYEFDGTNVRLGMHSQTDPVVATILSDMFPSDDFNDSKNDGNNGVSDLMIDTTDNSQLENSGSGSGAGINYEDLMDKNNGKVDRSSGAGSGGGAGINTGTGSNSDGSKTDTADGTGGNKGDGTSQGSSDDNPTNNPDAPCSK